MDIVSLPVELDKKRLDSKYRLVAVAAQRARELSLGAKAKIQTKSKKVTSIAVEETIGNNLEFLTGEEARKAKEEAKKFDYKKFLEEKRREGAPEDLSELEKDLRIYLNEKESGDKRALEDLFPERSSEGAEE